MWKIRDPRIVVIREAGSQRISLLQILNVQDGRSQSLLVFQDSVK
jgi:hypothetical protein